MRCHAGGVGKGLVEGTVDVARFSTSNNVTSADANADVSRVPRAHPTDHEGVLLLAGR
jgi:hypothetical protein